MVSTLKFAFIQIIGIKRHIYISIEKNKKFIVFSRIEIISNIYNTERILYAI